MAKVKKEESIEKQLWKATDNLITNNFIVDIKNILHKAKSSVYQIINTTMTKTYWEIGKRIVEEEQDGEQRAKYGKAIIKNLSDELTKEFGKGFSVANIKNMRQFYLAFEKSQTVSSQFKLSYSHYIFLARMTNLDERNFNPDKYTAEISWQVLQATIANLIGKR